MAADVSKIPQRVAENALQRLGIRFIDSDALVSDMKKRTVKNESPEAMADTLVDQLLPKISRDEARGQLETLAWLIKDHVTGGRS